MNTQLIDRLIAVLKKTEETVASGDWYDGKDSNLSEECDALIKELEQHKAKYNHDTDVPIIKETNPQ